MRYVWPLLLVALVLSACASVPVKQKVSASHQTLRQAIVAVDDAERLLCAPKPAPLSHECGNPVAATLGLTNEKHQALSRALARAYEYDVKTGAAIVAWRAGDPVPSEIGQLMTYAQEVLVTANTLSDAAFIDKAQVLVARAQALITTFREVSR